MSESGENDTAWLFTAAVGCPQGLKVNSTKRACYHEINPQLDIAPYVQQDAAASIFGSKGSSLPLLFSEAKYGGALIVKEQFVDEIAAAMHNSEFVDAMINSLTILETQKDKTLLEEIGHALHGAHQFAEDFKPVEAMVVHVGIDVLLHVAAHGLEEVAHAAAHAGLHGLAIGSEVGLAVVPIIGWALIVPMAAYDTYTARQHYKHKTHHAKQFASAMVLKSDCVEERVGEAMARSSVNTVFAEVCGEEAETLLANQIQRSMHQMRMLFGVIEEIGRCVWPHGGRSWSEANCAEAMFMPLRQEGGKPGMLFGAIAFSAMFASFTDELLESPMYTEILTEYFGTTVPYNETLRDKLDKMAQQPMETRVVGCMSIIATQRAYERLFLRFSSALKIWVRTFGRDLRHLDMRTIWKTPYPCRRAFYSMDDREEGFCKTDTFKVGHGEEEHKFNEKNPCEAAETLVFGEEEKPSRTIWPETHARQAERSVQVSESAEESGPTVMSGEQSVQVSKSAEESGPTVMQVRADSGLWGG